MLDVEGLYAAHVLTLTDRTRLALERTGFARLVIHAGDLVAKSRFDDQAFSFSPVPTFAHWAPWPWPGSVVVVDREQPAKLFARRRRDFWERLEAPDADLVRRGLEVEEVDDLRSLADLVRKPGSAFIGETAEAGEALGFDEAGVNPPGLVEALHETRVQKTPYEVEMIASANRRAVRGHLAVRDAFLGGERSELALHLAYLAASGQDDADTPYKNIVALGEAAAVLHHHHYAARPHARTLLVDAGALVRGYAADITRTHLAPGDDSGFRAVLDGVERLQREVLARIEVGKGYETLHDEAHALFGRLLVDLRLVSCSAEAAVAEGLTRAFFPHGLGHSLGVQVHDVGCRRASPREENSWLRNTRTIEPGQVFTIEPGFYLIDALLEPLRASSSGASVAWDRVARLRPYGGVRIEDDVLVLSGEAGPRIRNLTREAFSAP